MNNCWVILHHFWLVLEYLYIILNHFYVILDHLEQILRIWDDCQQFLVGLKDILETFLVFWFQFVLPSWIIFVKYWRTLPVTAPSYCFNGYFGDFSGFSSVTLCCQAARFYCHWQLLCKFWKPTSNFGIFLHHFKQLYVILGHFEQIVCIWDSWQQFLVVLTHILVFWPRFMLPSCTISGIYPGKLNRQWFILILKDLLETFLVFWRHFVLQSCTFYPNLAAKPSTGSVY